MATLGLVEYENASTGGGGLFTTTYPQPRFREQLLEGYGPRPCHPEAYMGEHQADHEAGCTRPAHQGTDLHRCERIERLRVLNGNITSD